MIAIVKLVTRKSGSTQSPHAQHHDESHQDHQNEPQTQASELEKGKGKLISDQVPIEYQTPLSETYLANLPDETLMWYSKSSFPALLLIYLLTFTGDNTYDYDRGRERELPEGAWDEIHKTIVDVPNDLGTRGLRT